MVVILQGKVLRLTGVYNCEPLNLNFKMRKAEERRTVVGHLEAINLRDVKELDLCVNYFTINQGKGGRG